MKPIIFRNLTPRPSPAPPASLLPLLAFTRHFRVDRLLEDLGEALLDFVDITDLEQWLKAHINLI
jgi:hypothetical protein